MEAIKKAVMMELKCIPEESFQECMEAWQNRMRKCIRLEGDYFELVVCIDFCNKLFVTPVLELF